MDGSMMNVMEPTMQCWAANAAWLLLFAASLLLTVLAAVGLFAAAAGQSAARICRVVMNVMNQRDRTRGEEIARVLEKLDAVASEQDSLAMAIRLVDSRLLLLDRKLDCALRNTGAAAHAVPRTAPSTSGPKSPARPVAATGVPSPIMSPDGHRQSGRKLLAARLGSSHPPPYEMRTALTAESPVCPVTVARTPTPITSSGGHRQVRHEASAAFPESFPPSSHPSLRTLRPQKAKDRPKMALSSGSRFYAHVDQVARTAAAAGELQAD